MFAPPDASLVYLRMMLAISGIGFFPKPGRPFPFQVDRLFRKLRGVIRKGSVCIFG
jgi:hypothetical protein